MSVNWECSTCPAYLEVKDTDENSDQWKKFAALREALIWASLITGFPSKSEWAITEDNWREMFERLFIAEKAFGAYRQYIEGEEIVSVFFTPIEVESMIGLRVNAGNKSQRDFDKAIMKQLRSRATAKLNVESREPDFEVAS